MPGCGDNHKNTERVREACDGNGTDSFSYAVMHPVLYWMPDRFLFVICRMILYISCPFFNLCLLF
ncbi:hypothetical protein TUM12148_46690 [Citrobacter europaeus]|nr:hypothetical protein TUM12148_46690 [Citrobacter europaeus]